MPKKQKNKLPSKKQASSKKKSAGGNICPNCGGKNGQHQAVRITDMIETDCWRIN